MTAPASRLGRLSSNKQVNPYKSCSFGICWDLKYDGGYDLGTKNNFKIISEHS